MPPVSRLGTLILIAMAACLLLPGSGALLGFAILALLWWLSRRQKSRSIWLTLASATVFIVLVLESWSVLAGSRPSHFRNQVSTRYEETWQQLEDTAARTVARLDSDSLAAGEHLAVFEILNAEAAADSSAASTVLLLDERGRVFAWGGKGLLHDIAVEPRLATGRHHLASLSAVTLVAMHRLEIAGGDWHLAAGLSVRTETFPFADLVGPQPRWTVVNSDTETGEGLFRVAPTSSPVLVVEEPQFTSPLPHLFEATGWRRIAVLVWAFVLLLQAWVDSVPVLRPRVSLMIASGLFLLGLADQAPLWASLLLAAAGGLGYALRLDRRWGGSLPGSLLLGVTATVSVPTLAILASQFGAIPDLGSELWSGPADLVTRLALALSVWAVLGAIPRSRDHAAGRPSLFLWLAVLTALVSGASVDRTPVAMVLLVVSGAASAMWLRKWRSEEPIVRLAVLGLLAALLAATGWELAYRVNQKTIIQETLLPAMAPPTAMEIESLADEMESFLGSWDVDRLVPAGFEELSRQDLAFGIWRHSPLPRYGGLSALRVLPHGAGLSSFSFGLPLNEESWVDWSSPLLGTLPVPAWQDAVLVGDGVLHHGGDAWGYAEYALALQPGFRLRAKNEGDLAEVLLRSGPTAGEAALRDLGGALYGLYGSAGLPLVSPWRQSPKLSEEILAGGRGVVATPDGRSFAFSAMGADGVRVLFLLEMIWLEALERVGSHVLLSMLVLGGLMLIFQLPRWAHEGFRSTWYYIWHSYSRRLVLVYSVLMLVPLGIINFLVVRALEERLVGELEVAGLRAVESAQGVLGEYVQALKPGFGIDAALDDELLHWLSSVVHHDVNLYWRASVYSSSKPELFTAGLLPRRIPGEIYSGLTFLGHAVSMRTNQAGRSEYLELYAPLTVPGVSFGQTRLIVSLPLLAQQEETAQQIASLRRRSLLGTAAVVLLIMVLGARLARRFTAPLTDIVEGTQRIAAGEASLDLQPVELELATLVDAIDDMAARIHAGRQQLLKEKRVVDRMVENITAGVVSLDEQDRVLMANRVASEMIGLEVGQELDTVLGENNRLAPLAGFVAGGSRGDLRQQTVVLEDPHGEEEEWTVVWVPLPGEGEPSALLVLEDVTEVLRGQRLQAWAEMARMIAHEIKNPLTPIRLSAEHMREVYEADPESFSRVFESCTSNILDQVSELQEIAGEFSTYSRIPKIEPRQGNLVEAVEEVVGAYRTASPDDVRVELTTRSAEVEVSFDAKLLGRAVRNLLENALRASPKGGRVQIAVDQNQSTARIVVADDGPGVKEAFLAKIFDPYFSTHDSGTGLGLPIAKRIAEEHGGEIMARNRDSGGLEVTITLPRG